MVSLTFDEIIQSIPDHSNLSKETIIKMLYLCSGYIAKQYPVNSERLEMLALDLHDNDRI